MNGLLGYDSALEGYTGLKTTWVNDQSLDLLTSSPAHYHCATDAPSYMYILHIYYYKMTYSVKLSPIGAIAYTYKSTVLPHSLNGY